MLFKVSYNYHFRFYLSFENSICPDYITEKFSRAIKSFSIPIVLKGDLYISMAPRNSYIAVDSFKSTKQLADYLLFLIKNQTAYLEYFQWRRAYELDLTGSASCDLCEKLVEWRNEKRIKDSLYEWYQGKNNDICDANFAAKLP